MEEKKLTDEEIVKSLEYCANGGNCQRGQCSFTKHQEHGRKNFCFGYGSECALDLIHRLQDENEGLKEHGQILINSLHKTIDEQKAEIERLTEENEYLDMCGKQFLADYQKCEIENSELQEQVDELKERYLEESKERCEFEQKYKKIQHAYNIGLGVQSSHWGKKVQQAEKDTAKEILKIAVDFYDGKDIDGDLFLGTLRERYGVEVE